MNATEVKPPPILPEPVPVTAKTLRRLFLTLFLRGRGARGLNKQGAPKSIGQKLALTLGFYLLFGCFALFFLRQSVFALAVYLHAMTFVFLGMFIAASAGEVLFNKEEADILMHRPVSPKAMLWAKIRVLVEVSLWLAFAFNLVGLFVGLGPGGWRFPIVHIFSTTLEALFCTGCVVLIYQLCLRWFGRERLESLMTISQVIVSIAAIMAGQILPQMAFRFGHVLNAADVSWWINLMPPAWFAGFDDAFAGSAELGSWISTALALVITGVVLWLAFGKLARDYELGLQALNETVSTNVKKGSRGRVMDRLVNMPPLRWWLHDPVERASFLLTAAYLMRDRDVKLRVYPGIAPVLIIPIIFLFRDHRHWASDDTGFGVPFTGIYLGMVPLMGLQLLQYSQQWQAADIFRAAPMGGPAAICHGARRAVICLLALPVMPLLGITIWLLHKDFTQFALFLPGLIAMPVFSLVPHFRGNAVPFSSPIETAKSANRGALVMLPMFIAFGLAGLASFSWSHGWYWRFILCEAFVAIILYVLLRLSLTKARWSSEE